MYQAAVDKGGGMDQGGIDEDKQTEPGALQREVTG